jgi:hypothetical protein
MEVAVPPTGGVKGLGKVKVTSAGAFPIHDAFRETSELNPSKAVTKTAAVAVEPGYKTTVGPVVTAKSDLPVATTFKVRAVEWLVGPLDPVMIIV